MDTSDLTCRAFFLAVLIASGPAVVLAQRPPEMTSCCAQGKSRPGATSMPILSELTIPGDVDAADLAVVAEQT